MNTQYSIPILLTIFLSWSCGAFATGPGEGGGGNIYHGKPLESYIIDPTSLPAYKTEVQPIFTKLTNYLVMLSPIYWSLQHKAWYLLPGPLKQLPADQIGSAVTADQAALQDFDSVWIDSDLFNTMSTKAQAELLLHEMIMGWKLLKFDSVRNQCLANTLTIMPLQDGEKSCKDAPLAANGKPSDLTAVDYNHVRKSVVALEKLSPLPDEVELSAIFDVNNFGSGGLYLVDEKISEQDLFSILRSPELTGFHPKHYFSNSELLSAHPEFKSPYYRSPSPIIWKASGACQFGKVSLSNHVFKFQLVVTPAGAASRTLDVEILPQWDLEDNTMNMWSGQLLLRQALKQAAPNSNTIGDVVRKITLDVRNNRLELINISEAVYLGKDAHSDKWVRTTQEPVTCSSESEISVSTYIF